MKAKMKTKSPKVFDVYWGNFTDSPYNSDDIIQNRNQFLHEYNLERAGYSPLSAFDGVFFDHCETYKTKFGWVMIVSPYGESKAIEGFIEIYNLYCSYATTYVKFFNNKREMNKFVEYIQNI